MPFDLEKAEARVSTKREKRFLKLLRAKRYVIFDWDEYTLWVLKDYKTDAKSPKKWMAGDEFLDAINYGEVAEDYLVLMLELNGITVEIRDCGSFKNKEERTKFFGDIREAASFFRTLPEIR